MRIIQITLLTLFLVIANSGCKRIVNNMAFHPDKTTVIPAETLPGGVDEKFIITGDGIKIQSYFLAVPASKKLLIYFHGNAGNIAHRLSDLMRIRAFGISVLGVGYRGYGKSEGTPSEKGIYLDGRSALDYAIRDLGFNLKNIYLLGRSIGTAVAIEISQKREIAGLILVSPLTSAKEQAKRSGLGHLAFMAGNSFNNIGKIQNLSCPVLVIHGIKDREIPYDMGVEIYKNLKTPKKLISIRGAGHNDLSAFTEEYWGPIAGFIKNGI